MLNPALFILYLPIKLQKYMSLCFDPKRKHKTSFYLKKNQKKMILKCYLLKAMTEYNKSV